MKYFLLLFNLCLLIPTSATAQNLIWAKDISSDDISGSGIIVSGLVIDNAGNSFITGRFRSTVDFDPGVATANLSNTSGSDDIFLAKYDVNGNYQWAKQIGSGMSDIAYTIATDAVGNIYIGGWFGDVTDFNPGTATNNLTFSGGEDGFIAKYDNNGNYIWAIGIGGTGTESIYGLKLDALGNVYVTGSFQDIVDFDPGSGTHTLASTVSPASNELFFAKYDANGNYQWANPLPILTDVAYLALDANGNPCLTGKFSGTVDFDPGSGTANLTGGVNNSIFIAKYSSSGAYMFANSMGNSQESGGNSIDVDDAGNIYVKGNFNGTVDFDPGASNHDLISLWNDDIFIAKYNAAGNFVWANSIPNGFPAFAPNSMQLNHNNDLLLAGGFGGTVDFDPGAGSTTLTASGNQNIFFAKYDNNGNFLSANSLAGGPFSNCSATSITADANDDILICGLFTDSCDFDPSGSVTSLYTFPFYNDVFFARYTTGPAAVTDLSFAANVYNVYPNLATNKMMIEGTKQGQQISCYNMLGELVFNVKCQNHTTTLDICSISNGIYLLVITDENGVSVGRKKFVKE